MGRSGSRDKARQGRAGIDAISQALGRAHLHTQRALSESVAAGRALLDVASLGISGEPAASSRNLSELARLLDQLADTLAGDPEAAGRGPLSAVFEALEVQIARWEDRSRNDPDARAVLRLFLGLREVLWELGLRPSDPDRPPPDPDEPVARRARRKSTRRSRVQRVDIQG